MACQAGGSESRSLWCSQHRLAALGPVLSSHLVDALQGVEVDDSTEGAELVRLRERLAMEVGRRPDMLVLMAVAALLSHQAGGWRFIANDPERVEEFVRQAGSEVFKHLGSAVMGALGAFGFTEATFEEYLLTEWNHFRDGAWPPAGAAYSRRRPTPVVRRWRAGDETGTDSAPRTETTLGQTGSHDFWRSLWPSPDRPSMIGAHLWGGGDYDRYLHELELAMAYFDVDFDRCFPELVDDQSEARERGRAALLDSISRVRAAAAKLDEARRLVVEANETMARVFST